MNSGPWCTICANFMTEWRFFLASSVVGSFLISLHCSVTTCMQAAAWHTAVPHLGQVSGELNTHPISNWIFNHRISSLKWWIAHLHSFPALISYPVPLSSSSSGILRRYQTFVPSPYLKYLKQHQTMSLSCQRTKYFLLLFMLRSNPLKTQCSVHAAEKTDKRDSWLTDADVLRDQGSTSANPKK